MPKTILFVVSGSDSCRQAKEFLQKKNIDFEVKDVFISNLLSHISIDMGIEKLPALVTPSGVFEGIDKIMQNEEKIEIFIKK